MLILLPRLKLPHLLTHEVMLLLTSEHLRLSLLPEVKSNTGGVQTQPRDLLPLLHTVTPLILTLNLMDDTWRIPMGSTATSLVGVDDDAAPTTYLSVGKYYRSLTLEHSILSKVGVGLGFLLMLWTMLYLMEEKRWRCIFVWEERRRLDWICKWPR